MTETIQTITLFDLPKLDPLVAWSPNAWKCKASLILHFCFIILIVRFI